MNDTRYVIGMMSGTSVDGVDTGLVKLTGSPLAPTVELVAFDNTPYPDNIRAKIFELFRPETARMDKIGYMNVLLGEHYAKSALALIEKAGLTPSDIQCIGSHGQTIWHEPNVCSVDGYDVHYTMQIGEGAVIAQRTGVDTISDFRVADMAMGGQGAPVVPFTEYLLYRRETETILLQNIGGIGNMTVMPAGADASEVFAFDTGAGNMVIDGVMAALTNGAKTYDDGGAFGATGTVHEGLLAELQQESYYRQPLPKTTGREFFGAQYVAQIMQRAAQLHISDADLIATVTDLTAWSIADAYEQYVLAQHKASELIVGGGGSYNKTLLAMLGKRFAAHGITVKTQEDLGLSSDAKEAVAFAILADCAYHGIPNNLPSVTGAQKPVIMGKLSKA